MNKFYIILAMPMFVCAAKQLPQDTPLHNAVIDNNVQQVSSLLQDLAVKQNIDALTPLTRVIALSLAISYAINRDYSLPANEGTFDKDKQIITLLLGAGADPKKGFRNDEEQKNAFFLLRKKRVIEDDKQQCSDCCS